MRDTPRAHLDAARADSPGGESGAAGGLRSLARGLRILACFSPESPSWSLSDLSRRLGIHRATVHRFLKTLVAEGYLAIDSRTGKYQPGPAAFRLGQTANLRSELLRLARPHMERLAASVGESVGLATWTGDGALFLDMAFAPQQPFQPRTQIGKVFYDVRSSHCRVFLAFMDEARRAEVLARARERPGLREMDFERYAREIERTAVEHVAFDLEGADRGVCAVAAPVFDSNGEVRASISIVVPSERFRPAGKESYAARVKAAAAALSRDLGSRG